LTGPASAGLFCCADGRAAENNPQKSEKSPESTAAQHSHHTATTPSQYAPIETIEGATAVVDVKIDAITLANMSTQKRPAIAGNEWPIAFPVECSAAHAGFVLIDRVRRRRSRPVH